MLLNWMSGNPAAALLRSLWPPLTARRNKERITCMQSWESQEM
jgi:hypothetical protein